MKKNLSREELKKAWDEMYLTMTKKIPMTHMILSSMFKWKKMEEKINLNMNT
jgi:hypothetical protein